MAQSTWASIINTTKKAHLKSSKTNIPYKAIEAVHSFVPESHIMVVTPVIVDFTVLWFK